MKNNKKRYIISSLFILIFIYFGSYVFDIVKYSHSHDWSTYKQYLFLFKDSVRNDVDTNFGGSYIQKRDVYNIIHYKEIYHITVWDFIDLRDTDLQGINIFQNADLKDFKLGRSEILNSKSIRETEILYGFSFKNINVNLNKSSKILRNFEGTNYKGFYAEIDKMSLTNENFEQQVVFKYTQGPTPTVLMLYNGLYSFYLILINADETFDESIIKIFDLK